MARSHAEGRALLQTAWKRAMERQYVSRSVPPIPEPPTLAALQLSAGMALTEGGYGTFCYTNGNTKVTRCDTNNWGGIQGHTVNPDLGKIGGFGQTDFNPQTAAGKFEQSYQLYATPEDGGADLVSLIYKYAPNELQAGDIDGFATRLYIGPHRGGTLVDPKGYYQGSHRLVEKGTGRRFSDAERIQAGIENIESKAGAIAIRVQQVREALGEPQVAVRGITPLGQLGGGAEAPDPLVPEEKTPTTEREPSCS